MAAKLLAATVVGYLLGSFPTGFVIGQMRGIDIRQWGSGATGGTNVQRTLGWGAAVATGLTDLLKGTAAAFLGYSIAGDWGYAGASFAALAGHSYPVWLRFRGGKSVATGAGALLLFYPWAFLAGLALGLLAIIPTRWVALGSMVGGMVLCGVIWLSVVPLSHKLLALGAFLLVVVRHRQNISRMISGTENRFGEKAKPKIHP